MSQYTCDLHSLSHNGSVSIISCLRQSTEDEAWRLEAGKIFRNLSDWKDVNIPEAEVCVDHVRMIGEIPSK